MKAIVSALDFDFRRIFCNIYNMIIFILGTILGVYLGWRFEDRINDFIESIKIHLNIK